MEYTDRGLWINGASEAAGKSILGSLREFREKYALKDSDWQIRVYGVRSGALDVWIGKSPNPVYRPYVFSDDGDAGQRIRAVLEHFCHGSNQLTLRITRQWS
jgi:hypothetical protein